MGDGVAGPPVPPGGGRAVLKRLELWNMNRPIDVFRYWHLNNWLILDPPYQRGDVWGPQRRVNFIRSLMQNIPIPSVIVNDRSKRRQAEDFGYAVIDGRQRITTILMFMNNELMVPGHWFGLHNSGVSYIDLPPECKRKFCNIGIACAEGALETLEDEALVFELVNFGGVPQGQSDLPEQPVKKPLKRKKPS